MTTYRIRPLVWVDAMTGEVSLARITADICYAAFSSGYWHGIFYESESVPHGNTANLSEAKAACESHWRGVLSAALEPVERA